MKLRLSTTFFVMLLAAQVGADETQILKTQSDTLNYALGVEMARNLKRQGVEVKPDLLLKGVQDGLSGKELLLSERDLRKTMVEYQSSQRSRRGGMRKSLPADNVMKSYSSPGVNRMKDGEVQPGGLQ